MDIIRVVNVIVKVIQYDSDIETTYFYRIWMFYDGELETNVNISSC